jgi:hypothetical protein
VEERLGEGALTRASLLSGEPSGPGARGADGERGREGGPVLDRKGSRRLRR